MFSHFAYPAFAYSRIMEVVLMFVVNLANLLYGYVITSVLLVANGETRSKARVFWFSFILCNVIQSAVIYIPYALTGFDSLGALLPYLSTPLPFNPLLVYFLGVHLLKMPKYRMVHMMDVLYLFSLLLICASRVINQALFLQAEGGAYNYLLDAFSVCVGAVLNVLIYLATVPWLNRRKTGLLITDGLVATSLPKHWFYSFVFCCLIYGMVVFMDIFRPNDPLATLIVTVVIALAIVVCIQRAALTVSKHNLHNQSAHIGLLSNAINEFRGIKHDFFNVLNTYSGFIAIGDMEMLQAYHEKLLNTTVRAGDQMDIHRKLEENPTLVALIGRKIDYATENGVDMHTSLQCNLSKLYLDSLSINRVLSNLLDNAVEAARESEEKRVSLVIERKHNDNILIVVTNSLVGSVDLESIYVPGVTSKKDHQGLGLPQVRTILGKYPFCSLRFENYDHRFSAYIEIYPL